MNWRALLGIPPRAPPCPRIAQFVSICNDKTASFEDWAEAHDDIMDLLELGHNAESCKMHNAVAQSEQRTDVSA